MACAILPHTPFSIDLAKKAHTQKKEVLLHLPMESARQEEPGPGKIDSTMPYLELALTVKYDLEKIPHVVGVNNHMGSLLTQRQQAMHHLMHTLQQYHSLFFVDSKTSSHSVAGKTARSYRIPYLTRDIFLDNERGDIAVDKQIKKLIQLAQKRGYALAIGHPYPVTLSALEKWLPILDTYNIKLVPLSTLITIRQQEQRP